MRRGSRASSNLGFAQREPTKTFSIFEVIYMFEKNVSVEDEDSCIDESSSEGHIEGKSSYTDDDTESGLDDSVVEMADPSKVKEWRKSEKREEVIDSILKQDKRDSYRRTFDRIDLESESDMVELEEKVEKKIPALTKVEEDQVPRGKWVTPSELKEREMEPEELIKSDKTYYLKILTFGWMVQGKINRALEYGRRDGEIKYRGISRHYKRTHWVKCPFCHGHALGEIAQHVKNVDWLLDKIYKVAREIRHDKGREDNLAGIAGAYALKGERQKARKIIEDELENSEMARDKARAQLAIALGKQGFLGEACDILEDLPESEWRGRDDRHRVILNLEEEILEGKGADYLLDLYSEITRPWKRLRYLIEKLNDKNKDDIAKDLAVATVKHPQFLDSLSHTHIRKDFSLDSSKYEEYLEEGQIHKELRESFLEEGYLINEEAQLSEYANYWAVSEDGDVVYTIVKSDSRINISMDEKSNEKPTDLLSELLGFIANDSDIYI